MCIVINTVILALDKYPSSEHYDRSLEKVNIVFTLIFILEMILKLLGLGLKDYFLEKFNIFDFVVVIVSLIDVTFTFADVSVVEGSISFSALRAFRLLRVFKLAKNWKQF